LTLPPHGQESKFKLRTTRQLASSCLAMEIEQLYLNVS
jgi:hypothetical protein